MTYDQVARVGSWVASVIAGVVGNIIDVVFNVLMIQFAIWLEIPANAGLPTPTFNQALMIALAFVVLSPTWRWRQ